MKVYNMITIVYLSNLTCPACKKLSELRISKIKGVESVDVDLKTGKTVIQAKDKVSIEIIKKVLQGTPYRVS